MRPGMAITLPMLRRTTPALTLPRACSCVNARTARSRPQWYAFSGCSLFRVNIHIEPPFAFEKRLEDRGPAMVHLAVGTDTTNDPR